ncbi:MAG: helix-turn-helix transcriptional regulator [Myxococcota bacterium]
MRARKITYQALGTDIGLSESGVKKVLNAEDGSVSRLLRICESLELSFEDLVAEAANPPGEPVLLNEEQQTFLVRNPGYYFFLESLWANRFDVDAVVEAHDLDPDSTHRYLMTLQRLELVVVTDRRVRPFHRDRLGLQMHAELGHVVIRTLQDALLDHARERITNREAHDLPGHTELGLGRFRLLPSSILEFKRALRETMDAFSQRSRSESARHSPTDLVAVGAMTVMAPFEFDEGFRIPRLPTS